MKRIIRYFLGISFLILGAVGLFLPILQGILFLLAGLLILAPESKHIKILHIKLRKKYPELFLKSKLLKEMFNQFIKKKSCFLL